MNEYDYLTKAKDKLRNEKYAEAVSLCTKALKINADLTDAYHFRGNAKIELGEFDSALEDYSEAIKREPKNEEHYYERSWAYLKLNKYEEAIIDIEKAMEIMPEISVFYFGRARLKFCMKRYKEAIVDFTKAINLEADEDFYFYRGCCYLELDEFDLALSDFNSAIEIKPDFSIAYRRRGILYKITEQFEKAEKDFKKALELCPDNDDIMIELGFIRIELNKKDGIKYLDKAVKINPIPENYLCRIEARKKIFIKKDAAEKLSEGKIIKYDFDETAIFNEKQAKDDIKDLNKIISLDCEDKFWYYYRAQRYEYLKDYKKVLADCNILIEYNPANKHYYSMRAKAEYNLGLFGEAIEDCYMYLKLNNGEDDYNSILYIKAKSEYKNGNYKIALDDLTEIVSNEENPECYYYRGLINYRLGQFIQAYSDFKKALELKANIESKTDEKIPQIIKFVLKMFKNSEPKIGLCAITK